MHKFKFLAITLIIVLFKTNAFSYSTDPKIFIQELVSDVMKTLENKDISKEDKIKKLNEIALEHVDIKGLAMYTLGDLRKSVDEKEKVVAVALHNEDDEERNSDLNSIEESNE